MQRAALGAGVQQQVVLVHLGRAGGELALLAAQQLLRLHGGRGHAALLAVLVRVLQPEGRHLRDLGAAELGLLLQLVQLRQAEEREVWREVGKVGKTAGEVGGKTGEQAGDGRGRDLGARALGVLGPSLVAEHIDDWERVGAAVIVKHHGGLVAVLLQVELQRVAVLRGVPEHHTSESTNIVMKAQLIYILNIE